MIWAPYVAAFVSFMVALVTLWNWRYGFLCIIAVGVLQDVLRKLTPGVPAYYIVWSMALFGVIAVVALWKKQVGRLNQLWLGNQALQTVFILYFVLITLQIVHSLVRWSTPIVPLLGGIFYLAPFLALLIVLAYARDMIWVRRFIYTYLAIMVPVCLTVYLSLWFKDSVPVLRDVGEFIGRQLVIYDVGTVLYSYSGFLRVGEIAAFHAATSAAFLTIFIYESHRGVAYRVACAALIVLLVGAIVLTGRRKMLMALSIFWVLQFYLMTVLRKGTSRQAIVLLILGLPLSVGIGFLGGDGSFSLYLERGGSVFSSVGARAETAIMLFWSALDRSGGLGLGAGVASQGMRYTGVDLTRYVGGASESGIGYIALELGVPGIIVMVLFVIVIARVFWRKLKFVARVDEGLLVYAASFAALLVANMATFITATQLYGDYFVLIVLGIIAGCLYSSIYLASDKVRLLFLLHQLQRVNGIQQVQQRSSSS